VPRCERQLAAAPEDVVPRVVASGPNPPRLVALDAARWRAIPRRSVAARPIKSRSDRDDPHGMDLRPISRQVLSPLALAVLALAWAGCAASVPPPGASSVRVGVASYYGSEFAGRPTASGERYDPARLTAAHRSLPFGTRVRVFNLENGRSVVVRVNDRGPRRSDRILDVSYRAAKRLGFSGAGLARVRIEPL
jgi:rare lipoprotein A